MTFKKCIITVCQNYFHKQCLNNSETVNVPVEQEQNQRRLKLQSIGCVRYKTIIKYINKHYKMGISYVLVK